MTTRPAPPLDVDRAAKALIFAVTGLDLDAVDETLALAGPRVALAAQAPAQDSELIAIEAQIAALEARKALLKGAA
jgi:hypothetical protein